jgi:asparagine synthetase B (glutamine-hydrolysing)
MRDTMVHRGPDDAGELTFDDGRGGFGFRRLSIIDLSTAGHQPMHGCDDRRWIVFNGEIYNHLEIRKELEARGHRYASKTDSETILHLYEEQLAIASASSRFIIITRTADSSLLRKSKPFCNTRRSLPTSMKNCSITISLS